MEPIITVWNACTVMNIFLMPGNQNGGAMSVKLVPGDMVYFAPNLATGFLIHRYEKEDGEYWWEYALRSPPASNKTAYRTSIRNSPEVKFLDGIQKGQLEHYARTIPPTI